MVLVLWYSIIVNRTVCWMGRRKLRLSARKNYERKRYVKHKLPVVPEADEGEVVQDVSPVLQEVLKVTLQKQPVCLYQGDKRTNIKNPDLLCILKCITNDIVS